MSRLVTEKEALRRARISASLRQLQREHPSPGLGLKELIATAKDDECPFCGDKRVLKLRSSTLLQITCGDEVCRKAYHRYWRRDQRAAIYRKQASEAQRRARISATMRERFALGRVR